MTSLRWTEPVPLVEQPTGELWVAGTRIGLEDVWELYQQGYSPEEIVLAYPSLQLADVYAVLTYALRHPEQVAAYVQQQREQARQAEQAVQAFYPRELAARVSARKKRRWHLC
ncbi:MAG: DUF433 domain-containing protein [Gloeomargarita sp. SKYG98]|nr:DUF433 domain-containing protein [Gloeomargarita sp. SKYG98]